MIDADYRGEVKVLLFNHAETAFEVKVGERVAQLVLERVSCVFFLSIFFRGREISFAGLLCLRGLRIVFNFIWCQLG